MMATLPNSELSAGRWATRARRSGSHLHVATDDRDHDLVGHRLAVDARRGGDHSHHADAVGWIVGALTIVFDAEDRPSALERGVRVFAYGATHFCPVRRDDAQAV